MGILNITPDSFSDGGHFYTRHANKKSSLSLDKVMQRAEAMLREGASIIDVGGESTRPGAEPVGLQEEMDRVLPVVEKIKQELDVLVSVDTSAPEIISASAKLGTGLINDVRALQQPGAIKAAAQSGLPVCLMHMQGSPVVMQAAPLYQNVIKEVVDFLRQRIEACEAAGIDKANIIVDPGFGFGKSLEHNLTLIKHLSELQVLACPILIGVSRKSMIEKITAAPVAERLIGSVTLALACVARGATIVRVHDVRETVEALKLHQAVMNAD